MSAPSVLRDEDVIQPWPADTRERWPIDRLIPYANNARTHDETQVKQLVASMRQWGFTIPVLVDAATGTIIAGHGRVLAARQLIECGDSRFAEVPVMLAHGWSAAQIRAYVIADNKLAENASWDTQLLSFELQALDTGEIALEDLGFDADELRDLLTEADAEEYGDISRGPYAFPPIIDLAFAHYRARGFPYPDMPLHESLVEINRLNAADSSVLQNTTIAYHVADAYHPERFAAQITGKVSPLQAFNDDERLRIALQLCLEMSGRLSDSALLGALSFVRGAQCAAQFRPGFALSLLRRFCPDAGVWLDTSAGWGGRLVAFAASQASRYIAIDPSTRAIAGNAALARDLQISERVQLIEQPAEDVAIAQVGGASSCDFAFTSPPYFCKEKYCDEKTQSWLRYPQASAWRDNFLLPTLALQFAALKNGAHSLMNVADVRIKGETFPLVQWCIDCAERVGFEYLRTEKFPLPRTPGRGERPDAFEAVVVLRKR